MDPNRPGNDDSADNPNIAQGGDYEYDEAHDALAQPMRGASAPRPVSLPPEVNAGDSGDYGYDEAHDFGAR